MLTKIKGIIKGVILEYYWIRKNKKEGLWIENKKLSKNAILGKKTKIRKGTEITNIILGDYSYVSGPNTYIEDVKIGKYCSIARNVVIGVSGHNYEWVTTSPIIVSSAYGFLQKSIPTPQKSAPIIGNDVWIGMNVIIMRGVSIGDGAVIAAGSVITKNVEPYSIVGGLPAKHLKYRFDSHIVESLLEIKWWDWPDHKIKENINLFYDIEKFVKIHAKQ